ncbi:MAG: GNAT family N-acetyltransferase [Chloroflexi bacterium]|nr:GNAT family N-acetyltransferase [Chloroflexota bacterium]
MPHILYQQRTLRLPEELGTVLGLADASRLRVPHVADWPYRFSSWAFDDPGNTQGWFGPSSELLGWVVMQAPFWSIDCIVHPTAPPQLYDDMLKWAQVRAAEMLQAGIGRPRWFISIDKECHQQRQNLAARGFEVLPEAGEDSWSKVLLVLGKGESPQPVELPREYQVRSLALSSEIQAYVAVHREVFQSESMTHGWRQRATSMASYNNSLDLVVSSDGGDLCGFCVAWLRRQISGAVVGQIEPLGVLEGYRGRHFSRALLAEVISRLRSCGADQIVVETDRQRGAAVSAYASLGFQELHEVLVYRYDVPPAGLVVKPAFA